MTDNPTLWVKATDDDVLEEPFEYLGCFARPAERVDVLAHLPTIGAITDPSKGDPDTDYAIWWIPVDADDDE